MRCVVRNCRGWGRPNFASQLKFLCNLVNLGAFCALPKSGISRISKNVFCKWFNGFFFAEGDGQAGGLCLF